MSVTGIDSILSLATAKDCYLLVFEVGVISSSMVE